LKEKENEAILVDSCMELVLNEDFGREDSLDRRPRGVVLG
jgi:hypothetical protein